MKKTFLLFTILLLGLTATNVQAQKDKTFLVNYFHQTHDELIQSIKGLDENQMTYKAMPESWSVSQCLEHIVLTEKMFLEEAKKMLSKPENPEQMSEVTTADEDILKGMTDRSSKFQAPEFLQPKSNLYANADEAIDAFSQQRQKVLEYLETIPEDALRNHITQAPTKDYIDAFQFMLYIAGHSERHTDQIKEVKASLEFPK